MGQRGAEYWAVGGPAKKQRTPERSDKGPLCLAALKEFAIGGLVDIGANLGKCSEQDLASQLVRASAAGVSHVILTGCSVKGSQDAQRICQQWSGAVGWERALKCLGAAARHEFLCSALR